MQILKYVIFLLAVPPMPPEFCADEPVLTSQFCPGSDTRRIFMEKVGCEKPKLVFHACTTPPPEDPGNFAPPTPVDPDYDEFSPTGPVDGPGEGPGQGTPADRPAP